MKLRELSRAIERACAELRRRASSGLVRNAKEADEAAAELSGNSGFHRDSTEFESLLGFLFSEAGKLFPGEWDDYPRTSPHL
jgi:23S rRNA maturation mini-RNase III